MFKIRISTTLPRTLQAWLMVLLLLCLGGQAHALIPGWGGALTGATDRSFTLTARDDFVSTSDGNSHYTWGYAHGTDLVMQYPGPTLIVNQGDTVHITLNNTLPVPVSIIFPGQQSVTASGGSPGLLTREAPAMTAAQRFALQQPGSTTPPVAGPTYTFTASQPGSYLYHSGTNADLQVEMGLVGAIIVRPTGFAVGTQASHAARKAYQQAGTEFDRETLFLLTEMDPDVHWLVYTQVFSGMPVAVDTTVIKPSMWFINGRNAPDTQLDDYVYWLPTQPYNALPRMHPGERLLMRMVNAGRDLHPFHHHGNHATPIARDGRVLSVDPTDITKTLDLTSPDFTVRSVPGQTMDLIYEWTGKGIGWDIYGTVAMNPHSCMPDSNGFDSSTKEWCADHDKPIPVVIPGQLDISSGEHYAGSPYLGMTGTLPQGHPGLNTTGGYWHMWHSHNEKEVTTDDIFPGGMMTMLMVEPWSVDLGDGVGTPGGGGGGGPVDPTMPTLVVLDNYDRGNANNLGNSWSQPLLFGAASIRVNANQASDVLLPGYAFWNGAGNVFGASQAAAFTFANAPVNNTWLMLKASGGSATTPANYIRVLYNAGTVTVATTNNGGAVNPTYTNRGASLPVTFASGDTLTAKADATGNVFIWKTTGTTTTYVGTVAIPTVGAGAWTQGTGGGRVGMLLPANARVDDFSGGTVP